MVGADHVQREIIGGLEADAGLAHVELLSGLGPFGGELLVEVALAVNAHEVEGHVVLLRAQPGVAEGLARVAVVAGREDRVRDGVADHAVLHALHDARVEVFADDGADALEIGAAAGGEGGEVGGDGGGLGLHGGSLPSAHVRLEEKSGDGRG